MTLSHDCLLLVADIIDIINMVAMMLDAIEYVSTLI